MCCLCWWWVFQTPGILCEEFLPCIIDLHDATCPVRATPQTALKLTWVGHWCLCIRRSFQMYEWPWKNFSKYPSHLLAFSPKWRDSVTSCECMHRKEGEWHKSWAPSQTIVTAWLIMATVCALSRNKGNSAMIAAGGITVFWMSAWQADQDTNSSCPTDAGSFHTMSAIFHKSSQVTLSDFDGTQSKYSFVHLTHTHKN